MPACKDCGNQTAFKHEVSGTQTRIYDDSGDYMKTESESLDTTSTGCGECGSSDIEYQ